MFFVELVHWGSATAVVLAFDIASDESRKEMGDGVATFPQVSAMSIAETGTYATTYYHRLECDFFLLFSFLFVSFLHLCHLVSLLCSLLFFFFFSVLVGVHVSLVRVELRPCSSHLLLLSMCVFFLLVSFVFCAVVCDNASFHMSTRVQASDLQCCRIQMLNCKNSNVLQDPGVIENSPRLSLYPRLSDKLVIIGLEDCIVHNKCDVCHRT